MAQWKLTKGWKLTDCAAGNCSCCMHLLLAAVDDPDHDAVEGVGEDGGHRPLPEDGAVEVEAEEENEEPVVRVPKRLVVCALDSLVCAVVDEEHSDEDHLAREAVPAVGRAPRSLSGSARVDAVAEDGVVVRRAAVVAVVEDGVDEDHR